MNFRTLWDTTSPKERAGWALVLLVLLAGGTLVPIARQLDPQLAAMAYLGHDEDPWGRPWYVHRVERTPASGVRTVTHVFKPKPEHTTTPPGPGGMVQT